MRLPIKGDELLCIKDVVMNGSEYVAYTKGGKYLCEQDLCITDNEYDTEHMWSSDVYAEFTEHFEFITKEKGSDFELKIYIDNGVVFKYRVPSAAKVREHASAIISGGYRHNDGKVFEHYPPHRILKVKSENIPTEYPDEVSGT